MWTSFQIAWNTCWKTAHNMYVGTMYLHVHVHVGTLYMYMSCTCTMYNVHDMYMYMYMSCTCNGAAVFSLVHACIQHNLADQLVQGVKPIFTRLQSRQVIINHYWPRPTKNCSLQYGTYRIHRWFCVGDVLSFSSYKPVSDDVWWVEAYRTTATNPSWQ